MKSVLIADDDQIFRQLVSKYLTEHGFTVRVASDGMQASMMAIRHNPDAVILDIRMPAGSGLEVMKRLRGSHKSIPVLAVSADLDGNLPYEAKLLGAAGFMTKPVQLDELYNKLCEILHITPAEQTKA
jgi:two-component system, OmpR family, response regulator CpxR